MKTGSTFLKIAVALLLVLGGAKLFWSEDGEGAIPLGQGIGIAGAETELCKVGVSLKRSAIVGDNPSGASRIVIACAEASYVGLLRIIAFRKSREICVEVESVRRNEVNAALCNPDGSSWTQSWCGRSEGCIIGVPRGPGYSEFVGLLPSQASAVRLRVDGRARKGAIGVGHVLGPLLKALRAQNSFSIFVAAYHGCIRPRDLHVEPLDQKGNVVDEVAPWIGPEIVCGANASVKRNM